MMEDIPIGEADDFSEFSTARGQQNENAAVAVAEMDTYHDALSPKHNKTSIKVGGRAESQETNDTFDTDYYEEEDERRSSETWAPIDASAVSPVRISEIDRLRNLEEEQDQLNSSLLALTTHFAQVQFRLRQIGNAPSEEKDRLLKELEDFAFRGCPDIQSVKAQRQHSWEEEEEEGSGSRSRLNSEHTQHMSKEEHRALVQQQRAKQIQLIGQLRDQLEDLERFAYEEGQGGLPSGEVMEKQRVIIDQLRDRIELDLDGFDQLSPEELQKHVDSAVKRLINPLRAKDQLVDQLKTQITDLERFVEFLQIEGGGSAANQPCTCDTNKKRCLAHNGTALDVQKARALGYTRHSNNTAMHKLKFADSKASSGRGSHGAVADSLGVLQMYLISQLGCQSDKFQKNRLKSSSRGCHWGDLRAALELAVDKVLQVTIEHDASNTPINIINQNNNYRKSSSILNSYAEDEDEIEDVFELCHEQVVTAVRKYFCPALRDLLQHGLVNATSYSSSMGSGFGCFPSRRAVRPSSGGASQTSPSKTGSPKHHPHSDQAMHAWHVLWKYYDMKHGREFSDAPVRKLSQSFNLDNVGGKSVTSRQMLLSTVDSIYSSHNKLRRSQDAMFKAFICAALNQRKLVGWLRMILRTKEIIEENYEPWSYAAKTGFEDSFVLFEKFNRFNYHLPVDLAVRPFKQMKDAF